MKKLIIAFLILAIPVIGYSQRTSQDIEAQIVSIIGDKMTKMTPQLHNLYDQYNKLHLKELRRIPESQKYTITPDVVLKSCFVCMCPYCGRIIVSSECGSNPPACGFCNYDNYPTDSYVMSCQGGMCGNILGNLKSTNYKNIYYGCSGL
jgi:hypothetical protein